MMANTKSLNRFSLKGFLLHTFLLINFISSVFSIEPEIRVNGPHEVITGDYEKYTCTIEGEEVTEKYGFEWKFKLKNGDIVSMDELDVLTALEFRNYTPGHLQVASFIRIDRTDVTDVVCQHSPREHESWNVDVKNLTTITADNDPCAQAEKTGKPVTSVYMTSADNLTPAYRRSHYIGSEYVKLMYGIDVAEIKLVCYSPSDLSSPEWTLNKEIAMKMKFAAWAQQLPRQSCKQQVLHIYQIAGESGQTTDLTLRCTAGGSSLNVNLGFEFPRTRQGIDFNSTENCINEVVEKFYGKELTGVGIGSSFVIVLMMVGMAVMKKQMNNQQKNNGQPTNPSGGAGGGGASSTEQLNPNENNYSNGTNGTANP